MHTTSTLRGHVVTHNVKSKESYTVLRSWAHVRISKSRQQSQLRAERRVWSRTLGDISFYNERVLSACLPSISSISSSSA